MNDDLSRYMSYSYKEIIVPKEDNNGEIYYFAYNPELYGCMSHGESIEEAKENLREARELYIETLLDDGGSIPIPLVKENTVWGTITTVYNVVQNESMLSEEVESTGELSSNDESDDQFIPTLAIG